MTISVLVVGAGITGATIARVLADTGKYFVEVIEEKSIIGGACHDCIKNGAYYQSHGAHIFNTKNRAIWDFASRFTDWHPFHHKVIGLIDGIYMPLPINLNSIELLFSKEHVQLIENELRSEKIPYYSELTLKDLRQSKNDILSNFGNFIYETVFKNYSLKQWNKIPAEDVINRVKAFRYSRDDRYFLTNYQGIPKHGYTQMIKNMLTHKNIKVHKNTKVTLSDLKKSGFFYIFYCGALDELLNYTHGQLDYRTCLFDATLYNGRCIQQAAVINYPNSYDFTRCHDYSYFMPACKNSYFVKEYPAKYEPNRGLERYYPINDEPNNSRYDKYKELLHKECSRIIPAGRLGAYKYVSMDKAIENAVMLIREKIGENL